MKHAFMKIKVTKQHIDKFRNTPIEERTPINNPFSYAISEALGSDFCEFGTNDLIDYVSTETADYHIQNDGLYLNGFNVLDMWQKSGKAEPTEFELVFVDM